MCCCSLLIQPASIIRSIDIGFVFIALHHPNNWLSSNKVGEFMANTNRKFLKFKALSQQPVMAVREKNHLGRGPNLGWQGGNFGLWGPRRIFLAMCAPTFLELNVK